MRANYILFWILAVFFWLVDAAYILWSVVDPQHGSGVHWWEAIEWVGAVVIALSGILSGFLAFYLQRVYKAQGAELPEDRAEAEIDDGDAEQGFFSPWSWWPIMLAFSAALVFAGLAVGFWVSFIGAPLLAISVIGWQYEYYRGHFAR